MTSMNPVVANALKVRNASLGAGAEGEAKMGFAAILERGKQDIKSRLEKFMREKSAQHPESVRAIETAYRDALRNL